MNGTPPLMRRVIHAVGFMIAYLCISSLLHFIVFPELTPPADDRPTRGTVARLPGGSIFTYQQTAMESDGRVFEANWVGEPGAGTARHTHPYQEVRLKVREGSLRVELDGEESRFGPGEVAIIPAGVEHSWENDSDGLARSVYQIRPAGMADFVFEQMDRAFGGQAGPIPTAVQTVILIGTHGRHTSWRIKTMRFLVAPTARLFGLKSYYEPLRELRGGRSLSPGR